MSDAVAAPVVCQSRQWSKSLGRRTRWSTAAALTRWMRQSKTWIATERMRLQPRGRRQVLAVTVRVPVAVHPVAGRLCVQSDGDHASRQLSWKFKQVLRDMMPSMENRATNAWGPQHGIANGQEKGRRFGISLRPSKAVGPCWFQGACMRDYGYSSCRSLGSRASLSQSPNRFRDSTVANMASPGSDEIHHAIAILSRPSESMDPQAGVGGGTPAPRKLRAASSRMTHTHQQGRHHNHAVGYSRQDVDEHDANCPGPGHAGQCDVVRGLDAQHFPPRHAGEEWAR